MSDVGQSLCVPVPTSRVFFFFFFNDTATTEIYTLSLHDALPIYLNLDLTKLGFEAKALKNFQEAIASPFGMVLVTGDRKSTRLNSSHIPLSRMPSSA